jgi:hypothetical protein
MPVKEKRVTADFTGDVHISWAAVDEMLAGGAELVLMTAQQARMLRNDAEALASAGRKWDGLTCVACCGPASMSTDSGRAYCFEHSLGRDTRQAADYQRGAQIWMERCTKAEEERDAMALALARKEISK